MESAGTRLKKLRLEKGLSLEEMHKKTKIHPNILKAIEEDSLINFSPIYIKGFIKIYCQELNVDPKDYLSDYKDQHKANVIPRQLSKTQVNHQVDILRNISFKFRLPRIPIKIVVIILIVLITSSLLFKLGKLVAVKYSLHLKKAKLENMAVSGTEKKELKKQDIDLPPKKMSSKEQRGEISPLASNSFSLRLGISAKEDCSLHLKADGKIVFWGILKKGKSESWQAKNKIELSLGNAAAVVMEINNKVLPSLGKRGQPIKNMVITREGWSIPR
jgi:cytoskeletal protein RodZ